MTSWDGRLVGLFPAIVLCFNAISAKAASPLAMTQQAGPVRITNATLNGMAVARSTPTTSWFEWGSNTSYGNTTAPQEIGSGTHVVRVTAPLGDLAEGGIYHFRLVASNSLGVVSGFDSMFTTAARVQHWGSFTEGSPNTPTGLTNLSGIASGHRHCLAIRNDGTVTAWVVGFTFPSYPNYGVPDVPPGLSNVVAVAGGFSHCLALKEDGTVVAWGKYGNGSIPSIPTNMTNVIAIAGGDFHTVALRADGTLVGAGTTIPPGLADVVAISCGTAHTLALKADGRVTVWGDGFDPGNIPAPSSATNLVAVATMGYWNLALRGNGTVVEWGSAYFTDVPKPTNLTNVVGIVTGYGYAEVLKADGTLQGWGRGQDATNIPPSLSNVVAFASGDYHRVGLAPVNLAPRFSSRFVSGAMNQPLTISLNGFDPNGDALSLRITSLPSKGDLYQYTTNGPGAAINSPGTTVAASPPRVIFVPDMNVFASPYDTFGFVANDGELETPVSYTVSILPPPRPFIHRAAFSNTPSASYALGFAGVSNATYSVWRSIDLSSWTFLGMATELSAAQFSFTDNTVSNSPIGFYRISFP